MKAGAKFLLIYNISYGQDGQAVATMKLDFNKRSVKDFNSQWKEVRVVNNEGSNDES